MPLEVVLPEDHESISLAEYLERLREGRFDLNTLEGLVESAPLLKKLANNKTFLFDFLITQLRADLNFQQTNAYGPEVFVLHSEPAFFVRANLWLPDQAVSARIPGFRYDICHDHNFHILTVGYFGPGYESLTYEYDNASHLGMIGETLKLSPCTSFTLSEGKVALYRAKHDIHVQLPPPELSISLNLIPRTAHRHELQFEIDEMNGKILRYLDFAGSDVAVRIAGLLGQRDHLESLIEIARTHPSSKVRALAVLAMIQTAPEQAEEIEAAARDQQAALVWGIVNLERSRYGACMHYK